MDKKVDADGNSNRYLGKDIIVYPIKCMNFIHKKEWYRVSVSLTFRLC
jgi:hypothetical protein